MWCVILVLISKCFKRFGKVISGPVSVYSWCTGVLTTPAAHKFASGFGGSRAGCFSHKLSSLVLTAFFKYISF